MLEGRALKIPRTFRTLVLLLVMFVGGHSTLVGAQSNLIVNGDAEEDAGGDGYTIIQPTGWSDTNGATVVLYGSPSGFPDANSSGPTNRGNNFFSGGPNPGGLQMSSLSQTIDLSGNATEIDGGAAPFTLCGFLGGYSSQDDNVIVMATFEDAMSQPTGPDVTIGPVLASDRNNTTGMCLRSTSGIVPVATRKVVLTVVFNLTAGTYIDGYADNFNFLLAATCPETDTCTTTTTTTSPTTSTTSTSTSTSSPSSTSTSTTTTTISTTTTSSTTSTSTTTSSTTSTSPVATTTTALATTTTTTTTTTAPALATTTTTLPGDACEREPVASTFASIDCRLAALIGRIRSSTDIQQQQGPLVDLLTKAEGREEDSELLCRSSDAKHARARLKQAIRKMIQYGHRLGAKTGRSLPPALRTELMVAGAAIKADLRSLRGSLSCPDDALER